MVRYYSEPFSILSYFPRYEVRNRQFQICLVSIKVLRTRLKPSEKCNFHVESVSLFYLIDNQTKTTFLC